MTTLLALELGSETIEHAEVDLAVTGFFADERPLRGAAGRADWRLCGLLSQQIEAERLRGEPGEAVLLASFGRLASPHVLAIGLGERAHFGRDDLRGHTRNAVTRAVRLGVSSIALAPLGLSALRPEHSELELGDLAEDTVSTALAALGELGASLRIRLLVAADEAGRVTRELAQAVAGSPEVNFDPLREASSGPSLPGGDSAASRNIPPPLRP